MTPLHPPTLARAWRKGLAAAPSPGLASRSSGVPAVGEQPEEPADNHVSVARQHDLDFLLGKFRCELDGNPTVGSSTVFIRTRPMLNGTFYQMDIRQVKPDKPDMHGRWVLGWSEAEAQFVSYYYDQNVMHGSSFSPGRQGAEMTFTGKYFLAAKGMVEVRDEFIVHNNNHFEINEYVRFGDQEWQAFDHQDCRRKRPFRSGR